MNMFPEKTSERTVLIIYLLAAVLAGLGLVGKAPLLGRLSHLPHAVVLLVASLAPLAPLLWPLGLRYRRVLSFAVLLLLLGIFLTVLRTGLLHKMGRGSDQGDCVVVAAQQMEHGRWPYVADQMVTRNAMSCGPGWVALQVPAIRVGGYFLDQILLWILGLAILLMNVSLETTSGMVVLIALSAGTWLSAADGNDFLPFGLLLAAVYVAVTRSASRLSPTALAGVGLLLVCLAQFRVPTIFLPLFFVRQIGRGVAAFCFSAAVVCETGFLLWDTDRFVLQGPMHVGMKLFRTGIGHNRPLLLAEFLVPVVLGGLVITSLAERIRNVWALLMGYLGLLFVLPAIQNLFLQYRTKGTLVRALEYWEGGNWIIGLLPLAALALAFLVEGRSKTNTSVPSVNPALLSPAPEW